MPTQKSRSEIVFDHAMRFVQPFRTSAGHAWAVIPKGPFEHYGEPLASTEFRDWLAASFHHEHGVYPGASALENAVNMLRARALSADTPVVEVFARLGYRGPRNRPSAILLHLANDGNEVVEITADGRHLRGGNSWNFASAADTRPLPRPAISTVSPLQHLRELLHLPDTVLHTALIWLFAALRPAGRYPMLVITGPRGSGKTTLARTLRNLIDPSASLLSVPRNENNLATAALRHHVLAFDHVMALSAEMAAPIAGLASGTAVLTATDNSFDDPKPVSLARAVIITAPEVHSSFADNAMFIELETIGSEDVRESRAMEEAAQSVTPAFLGSICSAVSAALANEGTVRPAYVSRFADVQSWTASASAALGLDQRQIDRVLATSPLIECILAVLANAPWSGTAVDLMNAVRDLGCAVASPRMLLQELNSAPLALFGIHLQTSGNENARVLKLRLAPKTRAGDRHARGGRTAGRE